MKNTIGNFRIFAILVAIVLLTVGCRTFEPVNISLDGIWDRGDIIITITGNNAIFSQINPNTNWQIVENNGLIRIGDLKLRNITQAGPLRWTAQELLFSYDGYTISGWENSTITMNRDGRSIRIQTGGSNTKNPENTYARIR